MKQKSERSIAMVVTKVSLGSEEKAAKYWRTQSYQVRLAALEQIRQEYHKWKKDAQSGFQRVYKIIHLTASIWFYRLPGLILKLVLQVGLLQKLRASL